MNDISDLRNHAGQDIAKQDYTDIKKPLSFDNYSITTKIDDAFLYKVEENIADISAYQSFKMTKKISSLFLPLLFHSFKVRKCLIRYWKIFKIISLIVLTLGLFFFSIRVLIEPTDLIGWFLCIGYSVLILFFLKHKPKKEMDRFIYTARLKPKKSDYKTASSLLKSARKETPFTAFFKFSGRHLTYHRIDKTNNKKMVWEKSLNGFAIVHTNTTLLYSSKTGVIPRTIIMYDDKNEIINILEYLNIAYTLYNFESKTQTIFLTKPKG